MVITTEAEVKRAKDAAEKVEISRIKTLEKEFKDTTKEVGFANTRISKLESRLSKNVLWGVNSKDEIYWSKDDGKSWHKVSGSLKQISVGEGIVWGVNSKDNIYWSRDEGKSWHKVNGGLKHISTWP